MTDRVRQIFGYCLTLFYFNDMQSWHNNAPRLLHAAAEVENAKNDIFFNPLILR